MLKEIEAMLEEIIEKLQHEREEESQVYREHRIHKKQ